jgi:hypothetical protein
MNRFDDGSITVLALCKGAERYVILHDSDRLCDRTKTKGALDDER